MRSFAWLSLVLCLPACSLVFSAPDVSATEDAGDPESDAESDAEPDAEPARGLTGTPPLVRYWIDESTSGQGPQQLLDDANQPLNLDIEFQGASPTFKGDRAEGAYLEFLATNTDVETGGAKALITGGKVDSRLHGSTNFTMELVYALHTCFAMTGPGDTRVFGVGNGDNPSTDGWFTLRNVAGVPNFVVRFQGDPSWRSYRHGAGRGPCGNPMPRVEHWVVDTTQQDPLHRVKLFIDGVEAAVLVGGESSPPEGGRLDLYGPENFVAPSVYLGYSPTGSRRVFDGSVHYAALYDEALDSSEIAAHAEVLKTRDDP